MHLFDQLITEIPIIKGAVFLPKFALYLESLLIEALNSVLIISPFRHMVTPTGFRMSVAMTNCGSYGWVTELSGYRYDAIDPLTKQPWPAMPEIFLQLAIKAALHAGFENFRPNACLINCYEPGAKLSLHQDKDEQYLEAPVVSVSLGIPATFLFGGLQRTDKKIKIFLNHGDVVVWGGPARLCYHSILPIKDDNHLVLGRKRINLTFRAVKTKNPSHSKNAT